jgi:tape measure domain-containing protein
MIVRELFSRLGIDIDTASFRRADQMLLQAKRQAEAAQNAFNLRARAPRVSVPGNLRLAGGGAAAVGSTASWGTLAQSIGRANSEAGAFLGTMTRIGFVMGGVVAGAAYLFNREFVGAAAQVEVFRAQLTSIEGDAERAEIAMQWVQEFARNAPGEVDGVMAAFTRLRAFGLDPMNGTMQSIVDQTASLGFSQDRLMGITLALGQAWVRQKLQGQDILQLVERGVPVWDLLSEATGKSAKQLMKMSEAGTLGRKEMQLLIDAMGRRNAGAGQRHMETWAGTVEKMGDAWTRFKLKIMGAGPFEYLKFRLTELMSRFDVLAKDGTLDRWATRIGKFLMDAIDVIWGFGHAVYENREQIVASFKSMADNIRGALDLVGGFGNALKIVIAMMAARPVFSVLGVISQIAQLTAGTWAYFAARTAANRAEDAAGKVGPLGGGSGARNIDLPGGAKAPKAAGALGKLGKGLGAAALLAAPWALAAGGLAIGINGAMEMDEKDQAERADPAAMAARKARSDEAMQALRDRFPGAMAARGGGPSRMVQSDSRPSGKTVQQQNSLSLTVVAPPGVDAQEVVRIARDTSRDEFGKMMSDAHDNTTRGSEED